LQWWGRRFRLPIPLTGDSLTASGFGLRPNAEVEFHLVNGSIILKKAPRKLALRKWKGRCKQNFSALGYSSVDKFIDDVRGQ